MIRDELKERIAKAISLPDVDLTRTADPKFGDFSTSIALKEAKKQGKKPIDLASELAKKLDSLDLLEKVEVKEPGFINFFLREEYWQDQVGQVIRQDKNFASNGAGKGKKARVEFVSANPTGPLHFGNARGGPIGDSIALVLEHSGYKVLREYIDNDKGNQVTELGKTLAAKAGLIEAKDEELTYKGEYTKELAEKVKGELDPTSLKLRGAGSERVKERKFSFGKVDNEQEIIKVAGEIGVKAQFEEIIADCKALGIEFDHIVHESDLQTKAGSEIAKLEKKGLIKDKEGAKWFSPPGKDDLGAVVVKSDGNYTYFTADVVYHTEKFTSGYDLVVDVFGSNTFGHVPKLKALAQVLDFDLKKFAVILYQFVRIKRGFDIVSMSKRAGNFVTAREVLDEVGKDAFRFFILMHDEASPIDFDIDIAKQKSKKNPVYYVQYAHARIASILAKSQIPNSKKQTNYKLLNSKFELELIKKITILPELVDDISKSFKVHHLTSYAIDLADSFHKFYENCKVISDDKEMTAARLDLVRVTKIALANTLGLLGVSAPEKM